MYHNARIRDDPGYLEKYTWFIYLGRGSVEGESVIIDN